MKKKILLVVSLLFGLMFINAGLNKFFDYMPVPETMPEEITKDFIAFMEIAWLMPLLGLGEIVGGLLFIFPKTRALGAVVIFPIMIGIILTHIFVEPSGLPIAAVLFIINLWVVYENRAKYQPMINS